MTAPHDGPRHRAIIGYAAMIVAAVALFLAIRHAGAGLIAPAPPGGVPSPRVAATGHIDTLLHVLIALAVIIMTARVLGMVFKRFAQPAVIGEIIAGILLGPSLLGRVAPSAYAFVLPREVAPFLNILAQVGVILYMFLVGLELDPGLLRKRGHATVAISHASIIVPFLLGSVLALLLYPRLSSADVPFTSFALFLGVSMSVTAFPVLARILTDRKIHTTRMGAIAITCAAVDDVTAWCLLAFVVGVVQARVSGALATVLMSFGFIAAMILLVRPAMVRVARAYGNRGRLTQGVMTLVFVALLVSAVMTDLIGIHAIFGAFALGAMIPHDSGLARDLTDRLEDLVVVLFLPAFFAFTGMRTQIGLVDSVAGWLVCGLIVAVASAGKFGGSLVAARLSGLGWRDSASLGVLMNTRGLMELIVLNIGLELKVISPTLFAMLVVMALATTFATTPILHLLTRRDRRAEAKVTPRSAPPARARAGVLAPVSNPQAVSTLVELAVAASRPGDPRAQVIGLVRPPSGGIRSGLREVEAKVPARSPALDAAIEYARRRGLAIDPRAVWTNEPAADILDLARGMGVAWLLLGFHRPVFGSDLLGGVVKEVIERAPGQDLNVGVIIHGHERHLDKIVAVVDDSDDGRAVLDLAARLGRDRTSAVHATLVPRDGKEPEPELLERLKEAGRHVGRWLHTDLLTKRNPAELAQKTRGDLVIIGHDLADELGLPLDDVPGAERCVVVVRGARRSSSRSDVPAADRDPEATPDPVVDLRSA
jgi:K+:H+ antiporter